MTLFENMAAQILSASGFGETNISSEGDKIWHYPYLPSAISQKERRIVTRKFGTHFLKNS